MVVDLFLHQTQQHDQRELGKIWRIKRSSLGYGEGKIVYLSIAERTRKRMRSITCKIHKQWLRRWSVYKITATEVVDLFTASKVIYQTLQHSLRLSNESWYMLQKNQLWKSQKEAGFFIVQEMHKYLDQGRN